MFTHSLYLFWDLFDWLDGLEFKFSGWVVGRIIQMFQMFFFEDFWMFAKFLTFSSFKIDN